MRDFFAIIRTLGIFFLVFVVCVVLVAFASPWVFDLAEALTNSPLAFEGALRIAILFIHALLLLLSLAWVLVRGARIHWFLWGALTVSFLSLTVIFFGDKSHQLFEEYSWIRYTTSTFLIGASACALGLLRSAFVQKARLTVLLAWGVVAAGLLYFGLDEVLETHEWIERTLAIRGTDYVTGAYVVAGIIGVGILIRSGIFHIQRTHRISATLLVAGIGVYAASVLVDAFDPLLLSKLRSLANILVADPRFVMSDAWYMGWLVRQSTNAFEEVFEHTAALLFFLAFATMLFRTALIKDAKGSSSRGRMVGARAIVIASLVGVFALVILSLSRTFPASAIVEKGLVVTPIASYFDGLFHTDELDFHPTQGVVLANEGRGNVYRLKDGKFRKIPDARKSRDADSVFADETGVYVADGNAGEIARLENGQSEVIATRKDGLAHPEAIVRVGGDFIILDESQQSISRFSPGKKSEIWKPQHPDWKTPEGAAYDSASKRLFVVDDSTGAVFTVKFGKSVEKIAQIESLTDIAILKDGSALLTDRAWGAIFRLSPDGTVKKIIQFHRMYRDLQGVAVDEKGTVYVTTSDGHDSTSFMPSHLFRIDGLVP